MKRKLITVLIPLILLFACLGLVACGDKLPERLSAPENVRVEGRELVWDEVEYADGYSLMIEQKEYETRECRYDLSWLDEMEVYPIELMAFSDRGIGNSEVVSFEFAGRFARPTKGLEFELLSNGTLKVSKLAVDENGVCVIPETFDGYKVARITSSTPSGSMSPSSGGATVHEACPKIKTLYLPYNLVDRNTIFELRNLHNLEEIVVGRDFENGETRYVSEGNCVIDKEENSVLIGCINSVIPDYVTKIGQGAFQGRNITSFTVPDQITQIGSSAFGGCAEMKEFHLPKDFTAEKLDFLGGCSSLTEVTIPKGVVDLSGAFIGWTKIEEVRVPEGVVKLDQAFSGCTSLKEVYIPESVQSMTGTFINCTSLERCVVPKNVKSLKGTFYKCTSLKEVVLPEGLEEIDYLRTVARTVYPAFFGCKSLTNIELPSTLKKIGQACFYGCSSLKSIDIPDSVTSIGDGADELHESIGWGVFYNCTSLTEVTLPSSLTVITKSTFYGCSSLKSIKIPDSVTRISDYAFKNCTALTSVTLPANLTDIRFQVFEGCTALEYVEIPENAASGQYSLPCHTFHDCTSLKYVVLPKNPIVSGRVFANCPLEEVYFRETKEEWESSGKTVSDQNTEFLSAKWYYYCETQPTESGNFWHFVDGVPTKWE